MWKESFIMSKTDFPVYMPSEINDEGICNQILYGLKNFGTSLLCITNASDIFFQKIITAMNMDTLLITTSHFRNESLYSICKITTYKTVQSDNCSFLILNASHMLRHTSILNKINAIKCSYILYVSDHVKDSDLLNYNLGITSTLLQKLKK